jgi:hypothetical protein
MNETPDDCWSYHYDSFGERLPPADETDAALPQPLVVDTGATPTLYAFHELPSSYADLSLEFAPGLTLPIGRCSCCTPPYEVGVWLDDEGNLVTADITTR